MEEKKEIIAGMLAVALENKLNKEAILEKIEVPKENTNGDFAFPCFFLAKELHQAPVKIAGMLKEKLPQENTVAKVEVVNGYLNFYLNEQNVITEVLSQIMVEKEKYGTCDEGKGKNVIVEYSSPNIAKLFHLGHFRNTVLGGCLYRIYKELGYHVIGVNHLGDWGRQFGLIIEGYRRFHTEYEIEKDPLNALSDIYVRMTQLAKEDESIINIARENFRKLEEGDEESLVLWNYFREVSLKEYQRIYDVLGSQFDSYNGEAFYSDKMDEVVTLLDEKGVLVESQGARVVYLGDKMPPCIIVKSDGSSIYATRDLAAILYRARTYDFTKCIYITATEQILHFQQVFEVAKYLVEPKYQQGLAHIAYGMIRLKTGKMSTREGNVVYINELIEEAIAKASEIIANKNATLENKEAVAKQVGVGALTFNYLKTGKNKDIIFDLDDTLRFDGETGPYVQYTYVRTKSILEKMEFDIENCDVSKISFDMLKTEQEATLVKALAIFGSVMKRVGEEYEPSILARYVIEVASLFSRFYNECSVANCEDKQLQQARCILVYATGIVLKKGLQLLGIECPDKM